ncbi:hypothetical protein CHUAL_007339 [Chamberlinius hualienensis]
MNIAATLSSCSGGQCAPDTASTTPDTQPWIEHKVLVFFRLWHMMFLCAGGVLTLIIFLCCCFKCRIPRTKQEIETDYRRKKVTRKFRRELDNMQMEEIDIKDIRSVLDKVRDTFTRKYASREEGEGLGRFSLLRKRIMDMLFPKQNKNEEANDENDEKPDVEENHICEVIGDNSAV